MVDQAVLSGQVVVVAHEDDFVARYIGRVLQRSGSEVLDLASFDGRPAGLPQVCGIAAYVVSQRHKTAICDHIACQKEQPPALLLIGVESSSTVPPRSATSVCHPTERPDASKRQGGPTIEREHGG